MIATEIIELAQATELKQLAMKDNKKDILGAINLGILEIHKRFALWQEEAVITMVDGISVYDIDGVDANVAVNLTDHVFLKIDEAYNNDGEQITINDESDDEGITTPKYNRVEIPTIVPGAKIGLIYRASPVFITNERATVPLPPQFTDALLCYIGYRGHLGVTGEERSENNVHYKRFDTACLRIDYDGMLNMDSLHSDNLTTRGFV